MKKKVSKTLSKLKEALPDVDITQFEPIADRLDSYEMLVKIAQTPEGKSYIEEVDRDCASKFVQILSNRSTLSHIELIDKLSEIATQLRIVSKLKTAEIAHEELTSQLDREIEDALKGILGRVY